MSEPERPLTEPTASGGDPYDGSKAGVDATRRCVSSAEKCSGQPSARDPTRAARRKTKRAEDTALTAIAQMPVTSWILLSVAAVLVGFAKTAVGGAASVAVVIFASALPARESTATLLPLLICGDLVALGFYGRHADWSLLARLFPGVLPGLAIGAGFLAVVDDAAMRITIGIIVLLVVIVPFLVRELPFSASPRVTAYRPLPVASSHHAVTVLSGCIAGFTTMTANAGGAVVTAYLISRGLEPRRMLGTTTWFFAVLNVGKLPVSAGLGLLHTSQLLQDALLTPGLIAGSLLGVVLMRRIGQRTFERAAIGLASVSALLLLL
jgi:uncharacterized membrane protein YfcA